MPPAGFVRVPSRAALPHIELKSFAERFIDETNVIAARPGACDQYTAMALSFPNQSRFYDATRRAVRFWGHDSAIEVVFFVTEDALKRVQPGMRLDEAGLLSAFDANRDLIHAIAARVYARGRRGSYDLVSTDF
jgi:hypothetical protein